jgi:hypothetical protein
LQSNNYSVYYWKGKEHTLEVGTEVSPTSTALKRALTATVGEEEEEEAGADTFTAGPSWPKLAVTLAVMGVTAGASEGDGDGEGTTLQPCIPTWPKTVVSVTQPDALEYSEKLFTRPTREEASLPFKEVLSQPGQPPEDPLRRTQYVTFGDKMMPGCSARYV